MSTLFYFIVLYLSFDLILFIYLFIKVVIISLYISFYSWTYNRCLFLLCCVRLYGSYEALVGGLMSESLEDFTGGISRKIEIGAGKTPSNLGQILLKATSVGALMGCSIDVSGSTLDWDHGCLASLCNCIFERFRNHGARCMSALLREFLHLCDIVCVSEWRKPCLGETEYSDEIEVVMSNQIYRTMDEYQCKSSKFLIIVFSVPTNTPERTNFATGWSWGTPTASLTSKRYDLKPLCISCKQAIGGSYTIFISL